MEDQPARLSVHLLGPVEAVTPDGANVALGTGRLAAVLALLAVESPDVVRRDRLIDELWGEDPPASAINAVQVQISKLRTALGQDVIERVGDGYRVPSTVTVDAVTFREAVALGQHAAEAGEVSRSRDHLTVAQSLWRGPALAGLTAPGTLIQGQQLEELRGVAAQVRLDCELALGRHRQALPELRELSDEHPYDERLLGLLMTALFRSGRQEEALAAYAEGTRRLSEDLGLDPTPELSDLHRRLLLHDVSPPTHSPDHLVSRAAGATGRRAPAPIGRDEEIGRVRRAAQAVQSTGTPRIVLIGGPGGMGKTTLVRAVVDTLADARVLHGDCLDLAAARRPYGPIAQALRPVLRDPPGWGLRINRSTHADLSRLIGGVSGDAETPEDGEPQPLGQTRLFEQLLVVVEQAAEAAGLLVLTIEDMHWCEPATRDLLHFLAVNLGPVPLLVLLTARTEEIDRHHPVRPLLRMLERSDRAEIVALAPLEATAVARLVGDVPLDNRTLHHVLDRSGGNPLHALELAAGGGTVTDQLSDLLLARVDRCAMSTQQVLKVLAAAGPGVPDHILVAVTGLDRSTVLECMRDAVAAGVVVPGPEGFRFRHDLIADTIEEAMLPGESSVLHAALADALLMSEPLDGPHAVQLARHLRAAHRPDEELVAAHAAASQAVAVFAHDDAVTLFSRVVELWDVVDDAPRRIGGDLVTVLHAAASCALVVLDNAAVVRFAEAALQVVDTVAQPERAASLHVLVGRAHPLQWARAEAAHRAALAVLPDGDSIALARVKAAFSTALTLEGQFTEASRLANDAVAIAQVVGAIEAQAEALTNLAVIHGQRNHPTESAHHFELARAAADASGSVRHRIRVEIAQSGILANVGAFDESITRATRAISIAGQHGLGRSQGVALVGNLLGPMIDAGQLTAALEMGLANLALTADPDAQVRLAFQTGMAAVRSGQLAVAQRMLEIADRAMGDARPLWMVAFVSQLAGEVAMAVDDHATALARVQRGFDAATSADGPAFWAGEVGALLGEVVLAGGLDVDLAPVVDRVRAIAAEGETMISAGERLRLEAIAARVAGRPATAVIAAWQTALEAYLRLPMPQRVARCHVALAALHLETGDLGCAHAAWTEARRVAGAIGAIPLVEAADAVGRRAGFSGSPADRTG